MTTPIPVLQRFARQKTIVLTTYRRDGTPVSIAVEHDHAYIRSYDKAWKVKRMRNNPIVEIAPSTIRGKPTGPAIRARARRLSGEEAKHAARSLAHTSPILQGILVPLTHRLMRYRTVHFELTPVDDFSHGADRTT